MNRKGIVVTTSEFTKDWLKECLDSIPPVYEVLVVGNGGYFPKEANMLVVNDWNGFELGGIARGMEHFDEFIHLMDTCVVKDTKMFDIMFEHPGSMYLCDGFFSYLGKYKSDILRKTEVPVINTKDEAIVMEAVWNKRYLKNDPEAKQFEPSLPIHTDVFEIKHGRRNMVLDNGYVNKYKAFWEGGNGIL